MIQRKKPDVDVVKDILKAALEAFPNSTFIQSLSHQYEERGGLSKKQLEGLWKKCGKLEQIPPGKMATLEALILKRPTRFKSNLPTPKPFIEVPDARFGQLIDDILSAYPEHKRVLFFQSKYQHQENLSASEIAELERFHKLLTKKQSG